MHHGDRSQGPDGKVSISSVFQRTLCQTGTRAELLQFGRSASVGHQAAILARNSGLEGLLWSGIRWTAGGSLPQPWQGQDPAGPPEGGRGIMAGWGLAVQLLGEWEGREDWGQGPVSMRRNSSPL